MEPKNVLPTSPINNLAGDQLKARKERRIAEKNTRYAVWLKINVKEINKITILEASIPSMPSMKFMKFIEETAISRSKKKKGREKGKKDKI